MHFHMKLPYELVSGVDTKSVAQFRRPTVEVVHNASVKAGDMHIVRPRGREQIQGLRVAILGQQRPVVAVVAPECWDTTVYLFEQAGYEVINRDAPPTIPTPHGDVPRSVN